MRRAISLCAPAKVNLLLRVHGRRADGFHELETLFQAIDFADELTVELAGDEVQLEVVGTDVGVADGLGPVTENLAFRAAEAYRLAAGLDSGVRILLGKNIPAGAGLGGGSSDAAAVLRALDYLTDGAVAGETLLVMGANLGSDVPFFLCGSTLALARGRGGRAHPPPVTSVDGGGSRLPARARCDGARLCCLGGASRIDGRPGPCPPGVHTVRMGHGRRDR